MGFNHSVLVLVLLGLSSVQNQKPPHLSAKPPEKFVAPYRWTQTEWNTKGDTTLHQERIELEKIFADSGQHADLVAQLEQASQQSPNDTVKLFKWGYATYLMNQNDRPAITNFPLIRAFSRPNLPSSYEFMRMRFLITNDALDSNDYVLALGERLAKADSRDIQVMHALSRSMYTSIPEARKRAFAYADRLREIDPSRPEAYSDVAAIYYEIWILSDTRDAEAARQTVHWLQEYLKRENRPTKKRNVDLVNSIIKRLNASIAKAEKEKSSSSK